MAVKVRERGGKWWVFIDHKGKRKAKCVGDRRAATQVAEKIRAKLALGEFGLVGDKDRERHPFDGYFQTFLNTYVREHCKDSTYVSYETAFRLYLRPHFGNRDISEITRDDVKRLAHQMREAGKSRAYRKYTLAPLSEMFNLAIEDGHLAVNPALRIFRRSREEEAARQTRVCFLTREEVVRLLEVCRRHFAHAYPFVLCLVRTGLRLGEAVGLQWADIDFKERFAEITRSLSKGRLTSPKSGKSRRVDLSAQLTEVLRDLLVERKVEKLQSGWKEMPPWVFTNSEGKPLDVDNFRSRDWPKLLAKAELHRIRLHDLRHTYASLLIAQGESLAYIKDQMGHHSIRVTVDTYGHLVPGGNKAAVDRLDDSPSDATSRNPAATSEPRG